ncbi:MAG: Ig-like domain-containing protein, partial [Acidobacteriota bacterium]|nr:Ig-like domain-containing protein [Acidobacteriota bacterium]
YHIVLQDNHGHTIIAEIPSPACVLTPTSPRQLVSGLFSSGIATAREKFDARFNATTFFQTANVPVRVKGVAFFDFIHGQTGVAPNGIELHPVLDIDFTANTSTTLTSSANPSQYGQQVSIMATVTNGGAAATPTGMVTFFDGTTPIGSAALDQNGKAIFSTSTLSVGTHSITGSYEGDNASAPSTSAALAQVVNKADQTITFNALSNKTYGDADFTLNALASSGLNVTFQIISGPATIYGNTVHITGAGTVTVRASQSGDSNYNAAPEVDGSFDVLKADQTILFAALPDKTYGDVPFTVSATGGVSGNAVTFSASGNCMSNGNTITITGGGTCTVTASQAGDSNYNAAANVARSFTINKATASITINGYTGLYDGHAHGATGSAIGVGGEDLTSLLNLGASFTDAPGGTAHWSFAGDANYKQAAGDVNITITQATATISVNGYTGVYDGQSHGATGSAIGVNGENLSSLLNLGASFTNVPGGTAQWSFAGNTNYQAASGTVNIVISKATPTLSWNSPADITYGTPLGATQLNATASVPGTFIYNPSAGTVLNAGNSQTLSVSFTPTDTTNYSNASASAAINVLKATPSLSSLSSPSIVTGTASTALSGKITFGSFVPTGNVAITLNGVTQNAAIQAGGSFSASFATAQLAPSNPPYTITYSYGGDSNFNPASGSGSLTVGYNIVALYDQTQVHTSGSVIPIKMDITGASGNNLSSADTVVTAVGISLISTTTYGPVEDAGNANPDNNFRFSVDSYIFNLKTTGLSTGVYNLYFRVGNDPTLHAVQFQIK